MDDEMSTEQILVPFWTATFIVNVSWTYAKADYKRRHICLLKYANGWPFCERIAHMPVSEASFYKTNTLLKFGRARIGV